MARLKDFATSTKDGFIFDPDLIHEEKGYNVRDMEAPETQAHIRRMADSIHRDGTAAFPPITIYQKDGNVYVRAGWCRRRAHSLAKSEGANMKGIFAVSAPIQNNAETVMDLLKSNDGLELTPLAKATALKRLLNFNWTASDIAKNWGVSETTVHNYLSLLEAPAEAVKLVEENKISTTLAVETIRKDGAILGTERLKEGVKRAENIGKKKATKKHLPTSKVMKTQKIKPKQIDWDYWGPKLTEKLVKVPLMSIEEFINYKKEVEDLLKELYS